MTYARRKWLTLLPATTVGTEAKASRNMRATERSLVRGMLAGDESAFEQFASAYVPALHRFAASRLSHDRDLTRDIVQSTLVKAIAGLGSFRGEAALLTWLCACCKTEIAAHFRRGTTAPSQVDWSEVEASAPLSSTSADGPEEAVLGHERTRLVHSALDLLPPHYSQVLEWKYLDGLPVQDIAERMNLTSKAAESLLTRARNSFRETYTHLEVDPGLRLAKS